MNGYYLRKHYQLVERRHACEFVQNVATLALLAIWLLDRFLL